MCGVKFDNEASSLSEERSGDHKKRKWKSKSDSMLQVRSNQVRSKDTSY
jgi:hypothetical protein